MGLTHKSSRITLVSIKSKCFTPNSDCPLHLPTVLYTFSLFHLSAAMATIAVPGSSSLSIFRQVRPQAFQFNIKKITTFISPQIRSAPIHSRFCPKTSNPNFAALTRIRSTSSSVDISAPESDATKNRSLKSRLYNGDTLYGLFLCSASPLLAEIAGLSGYDFVVVDMEHGYGGISDALPCLRALAATRTPAILRLPESTAAWAKKALDLGPQGIMFPMIDTPESAKAAVSYCRYPPNGVRGAAHPIVRASGYGIDAGYLESYEDELLVMCQVESIDAVGRIKEIVAVEGVDCIQMGPMDLSASMGYLWDPGHKKVKEVLRGLEKTILETSPQPGKDSSGGAYLSGFAMPFDAPEGMKSRGYHMISGAVDIGLFRTAAVEDVKKFKLSLAAESSSDEEEKEDGKEGYWSE
ncbi:hypothetical protein V2J09_014582 [Rumex salicifolius]